MNRTSRPYGTWPSPLSPQSLAASLRLEAARLDSDGQTLVWLEGRSGRGVLVAQDVVGRDASRDLTSQLSVRAAVGYGGGDFAVHDGHVYFVVHKAGRIYRQAISGGQARPISPPAGKAAAPTLSPDGRWVAYVHSDEEEIDRIAIVDTDGSHWPQILVSGADFYMQPRFSPDGKQFAWVEWDHPNMPWDGTRLCVADVQSPGGGLLARLTNIRQIAGGENIAIFQPEFTADGQIAYVSDETGWARLAVQNLNNGEAKWLTPEGTECSLPAWVQDRRTYALLPSGNQAVAAINENAHQKIVRIDLDSGEMQPLDALAQYTTVEHLTASPVEDRIAFLSSSARQSSRIVTYEFGADEPRIACRAAGETIRQEALSACEAISWPTAAGETAHGLYFPPASEQFESSGAPPLVVWVHGGPTGQVLAGWRSEIQFLTTRGFAVLAVNYRGSTGHGRDYMLRLRGNWGICDVEDSISGMQFLAENGRADAGRAVIMGGSAGGFTVLQTMAHQPQAFTAGICLFGVADQFHLASMTHKFESRYLDTILGPLPEAAEIYRHRSPINFADQITRPLAVFQGEIDKVVPQEQSDMIVRALEKSGTQHVYHIYEGEGHGWRKAETIEHFYTAVDEFLTKFVVYG